MKSAKVSELRTEKRASRRALALGRHADKTEFGLMSAWFWSRLNCLEILVLWSLGYSLFWLIQPGAYDHQFEDFSLPVLLVLLVANSARIGPREFEFLVTRGIGRETVVSAHAWTMATLSMMVFSVAILIATTGLPQAAFSSFTSIVSDAAVAPGGHLSGSVGVDLVQAILQIWFGSLLVGGVVYGAASMVFEQRTLWSSRTAFSRARTVLGWLLLLVLLASDLALVPFIVCIIRGFSSRRALERCDAI